MPVSRELKSRFVKESFSAPRALAQARERPKMDDSDSETID
jgi:hypothetical protein